MRKLFFNAEFVLPVKVWIRWLNGNISRESKIHVKINLKVQVNMKFPLIKSAKWQQTQHTTRFMFKLRVSKRKKTCVCVCKVMKEPECKCLTLTLFMAAITKKKKQELEKKVSHSAALAAARRTHTKHNTSATEESVPSCNHDNSSPFPWQLLPRRCCVDVCIVVKKTTKKNKCGRQ